LQRGELFKISHIEASLSPPLYSLVDLMNDKVDGRFYKEQLFRGSEPDYKTNFFEVEKVIGEKKIKGKKYFLVKFLYYGSKFNEFIPEENMKFSE
jgi:hypothetical protein